MKIEGASIYSHNRRGLGAPVVITGKDGKTKAVVAITLGDNEQISLVLFSQIDRSRLPSDEREAEGGEHQSLGKEGGEQPPGESVRSSHREEARKEGTLQTAQADNEHENELNMSEDLSNPDLGYDSSEEDSSDDRNQLEGGNRDMEAKNKTTN
nr:uncharacterized protein LOC131770006 isoform X2 [Pocillopora verrucosa]